MQQSSATQWTNGFFAGSLWYMYQETGATEWRTMADTWMTGLESNKTSTGTHDLGFMMFDSFGRGYLLTGNAHYRDVVVTVRGPSSPNVMRSPRSSLTFAPMAAPHTLRCSIRQQAHLRKRSPGKATRMHRRGRLRRRDCMTSRVMQMPRRAIAIVQPRIGY